MNRAAPKPIPALLSTTQAGAMLDKARNTVRDWIAKGVIPADAVVWSGRKALIRRSWIEGAPK